MRGYSADVSLVFSKCLNLTAFTFVICEHLGQLLQVETGDAVGEDVYREARFPHVETRGLHAGNGIGPSYVELIDAIRRDECGKGFACKGVAFRLYEDIAGNDLHLRYKFRSLSTRFERSRGGSDIMMLDINHVHPLNCSPFDGSIDIANNVPVVLGNVVLNVDNDK